MGYHFYAKQLILKIYNPLVTIHKVGKLFPQCTFRKFSSTLCKNAGLLIFISHSPLTLHFLSLCSVDLSIARVSYKQNHTIPGLHRWLFLYDLMFLFQLILAWSSSLSLLWLNYIPLCGYRKCFTYLFICWRPFGMFLFLLLALYSWLSSGSANVHCHYNTFILWCHERRQSVLLVHTDLPLNKQDICILIHFNADKNIENKRKMYLKSTINTN